VAIQIAGHQKVPAQAVFFAVMSALGYITFLIDAEADRRDALRDKGLLAEVPPAYGLVQWLREPGITRRARVLAQERAALRLEAQRRWDNGENVKVPARLDALASLAAARRERDDRQRRDAIATVLRRKIRKQVDRDTADIAVAVYDLDEIAARLTARADYGVLTDLVGADLAPARLAGTNANAAGVGDAHDGDAHDVRGVDVTERPFATFGVPTDYPTRTNAGVREGEHGADAGDESRKVESASGTSAGLPSRSWADAAEGRALLPIAPRTPATPAGAVDGDEPTANGAHDGGPVVTAVRIPEANDNAEARGAAVQEWLAVVRSGQSLSGAALGRRHGMSARWGQARVREAREVLGRELPGQIAIEAGPANGRLVELVTTGGAS
jgi:hypothetical protein